MWPKGPPNLNRGRSETKKCAIGMQRRSCKQVAIGCHVWQKVPPNLNRGRPNSTGARPSGRRGIAEKLSNRGPRVAEGIPEFPKKHVDDAIERKEAEV